MLAISLSALVQATPPGDLFSRVEVKTGRAQIIQAENSTQKVRQGESASLRGATHIEVPAGSEVRVAYPGQASLHIWGPASLDWQVLENTQDLRTPQIQWNFFQVTWCDLEIRRGSHRVNLPGDWTAQVDGGSMRLRGLATGPLEMRLNAGRPVRVAWNGERNQARPPITIFPGSNIRLEQPTQVPIDKSSQAKTWEQPAWPYRRQSDTQTEREDRAGRSERLSKAPAWPAPEVIGEKLSTPPAIKPEMESGVQPLGSQNQGQQQVETQAQVSLKPTFKAQTQVIQPGKNAAQSAKPSSTASQVVQTNVPFVREQWRGVSQSKVKDCGKLAVENRKGVEVRVFAGGKTKIIVDRWSGSPTWVMTPSQDYHLTAGCVVVFDAEGKLESSHGLMETFGAIAGRPAWNQIR